MQIKENSIFDNHYRLLRLLGSGGFSEVWLAEDTRIDSLKVALKIYAPGNGLDEQSTKLFKDEYSLVFNLVHTNLLCPASYGVFNRMPYLVLPFCEHGSSSKLTGNITEEEAWNFLHDVAAGLAYLHKQKSPVIHQDIKPANVLIAKDGTYMITDFGVSTKARNTLRKSVSGGNSTGGTLAYMAPERFSETPTPIKASDVWALGASLFELITGDVPFTDMGGVIQKSGAKIPLINKDFSNDLKNIISLCLQKETWDRPTAEEIFKWTEQHENREKIRLGRKYKRLISSGKFKKTIWILGVVVIMAAIAFVTINNINIKKLFSGKPGNEVSIPISPPIVTPEPPAEPPKPTVNVDSIQKAQQEAEEQERKERERKRKEREKKEQQAQIAKINNLLLEANAEFNHANYNRAFVLYMEIKNLDAIDTVGYTNFLNKAKSLIALVGYDNNVKALLLKAQELKDTSEVRNLISKCN